MPRPHVRRGLDLGMDTDAPVHTSLRTMKYDYPCTHIHNTHIIIQNEGASKVKNGGSNPSGNCCQKRLRPTYLKDSRQYNW